MLGKTILHYEIIEKLGGGGMGIVYKAEDTKLKRMVALKFLPLELIRNEEAKQRFIHEARAASALDHPNICTIHEIGETEDGQMFIAMAYYEGETLKKKIESGALPADEALKLALQIASGLSKAHEKGIIHRDIKPANVMVTSDGLAKIVDFGLAKAAGRTVLTKDNTTLGTVAYMSPEQAQGEAMDYRTDIWSFGVMLYEMITGQLPFRGEHEMAIVYSILNEEPQRVSSLGIEVSETLQHIIYKALAKNANERYQSAAELVAELQTIGDENKPAKKSKTKRGQYRKLMFSIAGVMLLITALVLIITFYKPPVQYTPATLKQITFSGDAFMPAISPDGTFLAYVSRRKGQEDRLMVKDLTGGNPLAIFQCMFGSSIDLSLRWTPDGDELGFSGIIQKEDTTWVTWLVPRLGGEAREIPGIIIYCWSPDGSKYAGNAPGKKEIYYVDKYSGDTTSIKVKGDFTWFYEIDWSPTGNRLIFLTSGQDEYAIWTINTDGTNQQKVLSDSVGIYSPRWSNSGEAIYYIRISGMTKDLMKIRIDPASGKAKGSPLKLQSGLLAEQTISLSQDNHKLIYNNVTEYSNLKLFQRIGSNYSVKNLTTGTALVSKPSISPDQKRIAFSRGDRQKANIYVIDIEGGAAKQLTFFDSDNFSPAWSPDGKEIAFGSNEGGRWRVWKINSAGGKPVQYKNSNLNKGAPWIIWAPYEDILYYRPSWRNFHFLNPQTEKERPLVSNDSVGWLFNPCYSPDKQKVAVWWNRREKGKRTSGLWVISLIDSSQVRLSPKMLWPVGWSSDGMWIYAVVYTQPNKIIKVHADKGIEEEVYSLPGKIFRNYMVQTDLSTDANIIVDPEVTRQSDIWLMKNFDPEVE
jgi:serine/threonine protein kinase/Tol biopolymer transport system component